MGQAFTLRGVPSNSEQAVSGLGTGPRERDAQAAQEPGPLARIARKLSLPATVGHIAVSHPSHTPRYLARSGRSRRADRQPTLLKT